MEPTFVITGVILSIVATFIFAISFFLNLLFIILSFVFYWYFNNSITERAELIEKAQTYEDSKNIINNIEQIGESVLELKYTLEELSKNQVTYNEPTYMKLLENINTVLQDIYELGER